ncbi:MAG: hypothetical protein KGD57_06350, partial [Candidatus Lokiarchaeota archaeon]|nr:hypothetical protein [Candidatus Lokiarchaeota archaeon]
MSEDYYLSIRELFSENILRNLILFFMLFIFTIAQDWNNILLLLFPLIIFSFSIIFEIINDNKWRIQLKDNLIIYNPLGSEKTHANRFFFSALLLLILVFWIGAESYYHPQLIDNFRVYFMIIYIFIYTFTFFWIFIDIWNYCHVIVNLKNKNSNLEEQGTKFKKFTHLLNVKYIKLISLLSLIVFLILNILNLLFTFLTFNSDIPGLEFNLPGTG